MCSRSVLFFSFFLIVPCVAGCGSSNSTPQPQPPHPAKRVLVSNPLGTAFLDNTGILHAGSGAIDVMDASKDQFLATSNPLSDLSPAFHLDVHGAGRLSTGGGITAVANNVDNQVELIDNQKEQITRSPTFTGPIADLVVSPDGKTVYTALRSSGTVGIVNTADGSESFLNVPSVSRLVLSPNGTKLLAFVDDPQTLPPPNTNAFFVIDTASRTATPVALAGQDRPFHGVFNKSETSAFILNCGAECGGTSASVTLVDFSSTASLLASVPVPSATVGLLDAARSRLYVAGSPPTRPSGVLQPIDTTTMTTLTPLNITDGHHFNMKLSDNRLYIGAVSCTPGAVNPSGLIRGCLSIFNVASGGLVFPEFSSLRTSFDVTAIEPIRGRSVVYVCEGGELDIFDTASDALTANQVDVVGKAVDLAQIDPL
jgi:hypothetical protein